MQNGSSPADRVTGVSATVEAPRARNGRVRDDLAYVLPMGVFLAVAWIGSQGTETAAGNTWYPWAYAGRTVVVGSMLVLFRRSYATIRWEHWPLGVLVGIGGAFQWIGMQLFLQRRFVFFQPSAEAFDPDGFFADPAAFWAFVVVRLLGAAVVVPVMEELFWRDYCWRSVIDFDHFQRVPVGAWSWKAFVVVPVMFSLVHGTWWLTSIVWALMIGGLLAYTRSLGACIIAHGVTNLLLGLYVLRTKQWFFW
jgi:CAAX prenyl protease-like protein